MESVYKSDIDSAHFHVCHVFDDVGDMAWFTNELLSDIVNHHAPVKQKMIKRDSKEHALKIPSCLLFLKGFQS